jgi:hypothetical protein
VSDVIRTDRGGRARASVSWLLLAALASASVLAGPRAPATEPSLATVLDRAASYVARFQERLSRVVAEEHYVQDWHSTRPGHTRRLAHRELRSDLILMRIGDDTSWTEFRDVFEVDGRAIRPRDGRLEELLQHAADLAQASAIIAEGARFNIGDIDRNVNTPLFALRFLERANQRRFTFVRARDAARTSDVSSAAPDDRVFRVATEVWVIAYRETQVPTLIRTAERKNQSATGRFWIEPDSGRVLVSELTVGDRNVRATIDVSFQSEPLLDMLVPVAMRERYDARRSKTVLEGRATYSRFRLLPAAQP